MILGVFLLVVIHLILTDWVASKFVPGRDYKKGRANITAKIRQDDYG